MIVRFRAVSALLLLPLMVWDQAPADFRDLLQLPQLKDFRAFRSSSNNPDWASNDDSQRLIPGETAVLALGLTRTWDPLVPTLEVSCY